MHADDPAAEAVNHGHAIQVDVQGADFHAVDAGAARAALDSGGKAEEQANLASVQREIVDLSGLLDVGH